MQKVKIQKYRMTLCLKGVSIQEMNVESQKKTFKK